MRYWVISLIALVLCGASVVAIDWGMWHLMLTGSCASGGPYVSARPCPPGTGWHILALMAGIFGGLIGVGLYAARGRSGQRVESRYPLSLLMWTLLFCTLSLSALYAVLGPAAGADAPKGTAIFLACIFIPMGLAPLLAVGKFGRPSAAAGSRGSGAQTAQAARMVTALRQVRERRGNVSDPGGSVGSTSAASGSAGSSVSATAAGEDPIEKIERLSKLREQGVITEAEFEEQKRRLLREV